DELDELDDRLRLALADWSDGHAPALTPARAREVGELAELLASTLPLSLPEQDPPAALRARLLRSATAPGDRFAPFAERLAALIDRGVAHASALLEQIARDVAGTWEVAAALGPGIELIHLEGGPAVAGADVGFVRVPEGVRFPYHEHLGPERVLVLQGQLRDSDGQVYGPGDTPDMDAGSSHEFTALAGAPLIYAVVVHGVVFPGIPDALG
ncbi:MAG: cupin domain-containing protein, partial [Myxococcales bacterium]|nr:cupin domain-containing protein [Myxococcales bacterium]